MRRRSRGGFRSKVKRAMKQIRRAPGRRARRSFYKTARKTNKANYPGKSFIRL